MTDLLETTRVDVHESLLRATRAIELAYRADLVEAARITEAEIAQIETLDDYSRV